MAATRADVRKEESSPSPVTVKKRKALDLFEEHFLSSHAGRYVAKIVLFGSLQKGRPGEDSDVDLLILATEHLQEVEDAAAESALQVGMQTGESVEPLVYSLAALRHPTSYFLYHNLRVGEEIYSMDEDKLKNEESRGYRDLAWEYLDGARDSLKNGHARLTIDAAYNAAELCAKGLLLFKLDELPSSHGGVITRFGELYLRSGALPRSLGRALNRGLALRNRSRYDRNADIGEREAQEVLKLAEEMIGILDAQLAQSE